MKAFVLTTIARQINGELVFVKLEKGYTDKTKAEQHVSGLAKHTQEQIDSGVYGMISCACERGVLEVEID